MINTNLTQEARDLIEAFAKTNKISRAKLNLFVSELAETFPKSGRPASDAILYLREQIAGNLAAIKGVTAKDVAAMFGAEYINASNTLQYLERQGKVIRVGKKDNEPGTSGKRQIIWASV